MQQTIISGNQLELYTDSERLLPDNIQPNCLQITMPVEPYAPDAKESPRRGKDTSTTKKRKRNNDINRNIPLGATTGFVSASKLRPKTSKTKKEKVSEDLHKSDLEDDSDDAEIANGLHDIASTSKRTQKSSETTKVSKKQRSLKDMLKAPLPERLEDDDDDLDIQRGLVPGKSGSSSSDDSQESISPSRPRKQRRALVSSNSSSSEHETTRPTVSSSLGTKPTSSGTRGASVHPSGKRKKANWLLESGSESESPRGTASQRARSEKPKSNGLGTHFRSAKSLGVIETTSSPRSSPNRTSVTVNSDEKASLLHEKDTSDAESPEPTFAVARPGKSKPKKQQVVAASSSPLDERRDAPRRLMRRSSPSLMGPPPIPQPRERKQTRPKLRTHDNPMLFDVEAAHSGEEVSEGDGSDVDMVESESDRRFLEELPETQVSPSYNQTAAYRAGLMTQIPEAGPAFQTKRKRVGPFAGGRTQVPKPADWSSSPRRDSEYDEYEMGSFVVQDDDTLLYDQSSES